MKKTILLVLLTLFLVSCGNSKRVTKSTSKKYKTETTSSSKKLDKVVNNARMFEGTRYKFGGTTRSGMDCSGLIYVAFGKERIELPRVSRDMATRGKQVPLSKASKGDLVFFQTNKNKQVINHVGLVTSTKGGNVQFIHATTSKGVIISSLDERYWKAAFVEARRII